MPIPTGQNVMNLARSILGDTEVPGGQIFTNTLLQGANNDGPYVSAFQWFFERMRTTSDRRSRRTQYGLVNPNISVVNPLTLGIANFAGPVNIWERSLANPPSYVPSAVVQTVAAPGVDPYVQIAIAHNGAITNGMTVECYLFAGITDDINDGWTVNVPDNNHIRLMGCTATGTWTNGSGLVLVGSESWPANAMGRSWDLIGQLPLNPQGTQQTQFIFYSWDSGVLRFPPLNVSREIRITYDLSATPPSNSNASLGVDECLNVLAYRTAAIAGASKGIRTQDPADLFAQSERYWQEFRQPSLKILQQERFIPPRYRTKRNVGLYNSY